MTVVGSAFGLVGEPLAAGEHRQRLRHGSNAPSGSGDHQNAIEPLAIEWLGVTRLHRKATAREQQRPRMDFVGIDKAKFGRDQIFSRHD
jgi:hypothetical protein